MLWIHLRSTLWTGAVAAEIMVVSSCTIAPTYNSSAFKGAPNVLLDSEIASASPLTALDAVERLRPRFLMAGGGGRFQPVVYLDGMRLGGVDQLRGITASSISEIRFLSPLEATATYGTSGRSGGAIVVRTKVGN